MSHHFSTCQKHNITNNPYLVFSELTAGSTIGFEFMSNCRDELSASSLNHPEEKLIPIA